SGIDLGDAGALRSTAYRGRDVVNDGVVGDQDGNPGTAATIHEADRAATGGGVVVDQVLKQNGVSAIGGGEGASGVTRRVVANRVVADQDVLRRPDVDARAGEIVLDGVPDDSRTGQQGILGS